MHRTASWSELSGRYAEMPPDEFHRTEPDAWRLQDPANKQGSAGTMDFDLGWKVSADEDHVQIVADNIYRERIEAGIAREQARKDLPLSAYTRWVWKVDLHNLLHFLRLRLAPDAQLEIRLYARAIAAMVERLFPATWEAFIDYRLEAMTLSRLEAGVIRTVVEREAAASPDESCGLWGLQGREKAELLAKLARLGLVAGEGGRA